MHAVTPEERREGVDPCTKHLQSNEVPSHGFKLTSPRSSTPQKPQIPVYFNQSRGDQSIDVSQSSYTMSYFFFCF